MNSYNPHHVHQPTASGSYDSSSVSSTASPQSKVNPNMGFAPMTAPNRSSSNLSPFQTSHHPTRPPYTSYDSGSISPNDRSGQNFDTFLPDGMTVQENAGSQASPAVLHNAKRAYRQRRKDPSCDACRERKVKVSSLALSPVSPLRHVIVRCNRYVELFRVLEQERQMSIHKRNQQTHVINKVSKKLVDYSKCMKSSQNSGKCRT